MELNLPKNNFTLTLHKTVRGGADIVEATLPSSSVFEQGLLVIVRAQTSNIYNLMISMATTVINYFIMTIFYMYYKTFYYALI